MDHNPNLSTWAYNLGYRLEGRTGTYDELMLYKGRELKRVFQHWENPSIISMEEILRDIENKETSPRC